MNRIPTPRDGPARPREHDGLTALVGYLSERNYVFTTPTPATHRRVLANRGGRAAGDDRDIFGWSMAFGPHLLPPRLLDDLVAGGIVVTGPGGLRSLVRVSSLGRHLIVHSVFPTDERDAVFFGPDSYRFAALIRRELTDLPRRTAMRLADIGTGTGVAAIVAADLCPGIEIVATDINPRALQLAAFNAAAAGTAIDAYLTGDLSPLPGRFDVILANPPYLMDPSGRTYRDGGDLHGAALSLQMAAAGIARLAPGGRCILYTGSAIIDGRDPLRERLGALAERSNCRLRYEELDPDVFGEELETAAYRDVDRIAIVSAVMDKTATA